ncbi:MAG TPA: phage portal protein [Stellaceae bacterium]|nr:phage portal protein [Stellaceae bacterium]
MPDKLLARFVRSAGYVLTGNAPADWFGPQQPLPPQAPPDVAGRQFDYPFGFNLAVTPRSQERTGFDELRGLADSYDLLRSVIETRKDQMERLTWRIRPRALVQTGSTSDPRLSALTQFFHCPDRRHGWASWLRMLLEDLLVIDAPTLYKRRTRGGALYALELLDGATIKRLIDDWGRAPLPPAYQQILKGVPAVDYAADELIYAPRNPRVHKAYGFSPVEQVQMSVNIALRRQIYQLQYYTEGNVPEALIGVPENWNPDQIRQFQAYWDGLNAGDTAERRHAKFVPGGVAKTFVPVREPAMKDAFDEWLARIVCYAFSVPPSAFTSQVNRATAESAQDVALSEGLAPLQLWVKHLIDRVIAEDFGASDLEFAWDQDKDTDPAQTASIASDYVRSGIKSINEIRAELGLPPVAGGEVPKIQTAQGLMPLTQASGGAAPASGSASAAKAASVSIADEKLERFNSNHFGPGDRGGQFAPAGEGGGGDPSLVRPVVYRPGNGHSESAGDPIVPVQEPGMGRLGGSLGRWLQALPPEEPGTPPIKGPIQPAPETLSTSSPKAPSTPAEPSAAPKEPKSPPSEEAPPGIGHNSPPPDKAMPAPTPKPAPPDKPYQLPAPASRSDSYNAGKDVAEKLKDAIANGWHDVAQQIADVGDTAHRVKDQISNIIADVDFGLGAPYDLQTLIDNTKGPSQAGYEDHHIVPAQRGTDDKGLSPEDEKRLESRENFVRIPKYVHQQITNYYKEPIKDPPFNGRSPIDYLHDKNFDDRYQFGLGVLREFGVIK